MVSRNDNAARAPCREDGVRRPDDGARWLDIDSLQHHLADMDDGRKMEYAQMAVLVRYGAT